jgi:hypothetical protein
VQQRRIETGPLQEDGLRVVTAGLKPEEWIVVGGIQQVRPRMTIVRDQQPMPTLGGPAQVPQTAEKTGAPASTTGQGTQGKAGASKAGISQKLNLLGEQLMNDPPGSAGR